MVIGFSNHKQKPTKEVEVVTHKTNNYPLK